MAFHWLRSQVSTFTFPGNGANLNHPALVIPANGRLVKILLHGVATSWLQSGSNQTNLGLWSYLGNVHFTAGPYVGTSIRKLNCRIPQNTTVFHDSVSITTTYTGFFNAGDQDLGFNEKVSRGGQGKAASTLQFDAGLVVSSAALSSTVTNFYYQAEFAALYEL